MKTIKTSQKSTPKIKFILYFFFVVMVISCSKDDAPPTAPVAVIESTPEEEGKEIILSSEKQMTSFQFTGIENNGVTVNIPGEIDEEGKTITIAMPNKTEITDLEPVLEIPEKAIYEPKGPQDFSTPINYTITAEDGTSRTYLVTVEVALSQKEILLLISAVNPGNTLNWNETDNLSDWEEVTLDGNGDIIELRMNARGLTNLPPEIRQLGSLEVLFLANMQVESLPPEIGQLSNLKLLHAQVSLSSLPAEIGQLGSLESLDLNVNFLSNLPPEIGQLGSLTSLSVFGNQLNSLPPEIGQLNSLENLALGNNNLSSLPTEIKQLVNLKTLNLRNNNLSQFNHVPFIPSGGLGDISALDCSTNTNLEELRLEGNPDLEVLNQCICDLDLDTGGSVDIDVVPNGVRCEDNNVIGN